MPQPSELPEWADGGSAQLVEPVSGKKQVGWTSGEKPANQILNWWQNLVFLWITWLSSFWDSSGDLTLATNAWVKVSGTGYFSITGTGHYLRGGLARKFPSCLAMFPTHNGAESPNNACYYDMDSGNGAPAVSLGGIGVVLGNSGTNHFVVARIPLTFDEGEQINEVQFNYVPDFTGGVTYSWALNKCTEAGGLSGGDTAIASGTFAPNASPAWTVSATTGLTETVTNTANTTYNFTVQAFTGTVQAIPQLGGVIVTTSVPA